MKEYKINSKTVMGFALLLLMAINSFALNFSGSSDFNAQITENQALSKAPLASADHDIGINGERLLDFDNTTVLRRGVDQLNITFNNTDSGFTATKVEANITLNGGVQFNVSLTDLSSGIWTVNFTAGTANATGEASIMILVTDVAGIIQNSADNYRDGYFIITNNLPAVGVAMNATKIYSGQNLSLSFTPSDIENNVDNLIWHISVHKYDGTEVAVLVNNESIFSHELAIPLPLDDLDEDYAPGQMYINGTCWDLDDGTQSIKYYFDILNNEPIISNVEFEIDGEEVSDAVVSVKRKTEVLSIKVTASDLDGNTSLQMKIGATDPKTGLNFLFPPSEFTNIVINDQFTGLFIKNITFPSYTSLGVVFLNISVYEPASGLTDTWIKTVIVTNNLPEVLDFKINGKSGGHLSYFKEDSLNFTFSISDDDTSIKFVSVALYYEDGDIMVNYTVPYTGNGTEIIIRAVDLPTGDYYAYLVVIDDSGVLVTGDPIAFDITIDESQDPITWLLFAVGIVLGLTVGLGLMALRIKKKKTGESSTMDKVTESDKVEEDKATESSKPKSKKQSKKSKKKKKLIRKL